MLLFFPSFLGKDILIVPHNKETSDAYDNSIICYFKA